MYSTYNVTLCVRVCVLLRIHHSMRMSILSSMLSPTLQYFSTLSHKRHDFRKTFIEHEMRLLILCASYV